MKSIVYFTLIALASAASVPLFTRNNQATCATCNTLAGQDLCDTTTSCIDTGTKAYCACRAGYKAAKGNPGPSVQFRLNGADFENRVFVPTGVACDTLCNDPYAGPGPKGLCSEVMLTKCAT